MFSIYDGRTEFYQWDIDRKLIVEDSTIKEVHFCNKTDECSLVCETFKEGEMILVNVPNILLQTDWKIRVYAFTGDYTKHEACFKVNSRTKPADYVYTETDIKKYEDHEERITTLENASPSARADAEGAELFNGATCASGINSHAEGQGSNATGLAAHAEGINIPDTENGVVTSKFSFPTYDINLKKQVTVKLET